MARRPAADRPAASSELSRPSGATLAASSLLSSAGHAPRCGVSMSGQTQPMVSGFTVRAACFPGQNGRRVRATSSSAPALLSCAASGYTPNVRIPAWVTSNVMVHGSVPCGGTRPGRVSSAPGTRASRPDAPCVVR